MRGRRNLIAALTLLSPLMNAAVAGVWTSGGSELIKDSANPWFLQNTKTVHTCIIFDPATFHTLNNNPEDLRTAIEAALKYWREEFAKSWSIANLIKVATQDFSEQKFLQVPIDGVLKQKCPKSTDLTLQFGWLSKEQEKWLFIKSSREQI